MSTEYQANLRRQMLEISQDKDMTPREKAFAMQRLMAGQWLRQSLDSSISNAEALADQPDSGAHEGESDAEVEAEAGMSSLKFAPSVTAEQRAALVITPADLVPSYHDEENKVLGCQHYVRSCKKIAACCKKPVPCRVCHDDSASHKIDRYATELMLCMHCHMVQPIAQTCCNAECGRVLGAYYCDKCRFHDSTPNKSIFHCDGCGLCRVGKGLGIDFFHCDSCGLCLSLQQQNNHKCLQDSAKGDCPVCLEYLFTSRAPLQFMRCGHSIHYHCWAEYVKTNYVCPLCQKSLFDMRRTFASLDAAIAMQPMPAEYRETRATVLCNDCEKNDTVPYHFIGLKCSHCGSYNTRLTSMINKPEYLRNGSLPSMSYTVPAINDEDDSNDDDNEEDDDEEDDDDVYHDLEEYPHDEEVD